MFKKYLIPTALILIFILAACGGQQTAEPSTDAPASQPAAGTDSDGAMDEMTESHDTGMDESQDNELGEMAESHDDDLDATGMAEETEGHDSDMDAAAMDETDGDAGMEMAGEAESMESSSADMMAAPAWQTLARDQRGDGRSLLLRRFQRQDCFRGANGDLVQQLPLAAGPGARGKSAVRR